MMGKVMNAASLVVASILSTTVLAQPPRQVPAGTEMKKDLTYAKIGDRELKLDLYLPEKADKSLPLVIWIHGGGWMAGTKDGCPARRLTSEGYAVASVEYRLSGEAVFPAQIEDCKAAVRWLRANAEKYGINPNRFGVWGSSAGGHLVAMLGTTSDTENFDVGEHLDVSSRVQAVCDYYGPTDLLKMDEGKPANARRRHDAPDSPESKLIGGPILENKEKAAKANPINYISAKTPPFLIVHGDVDPTVAHSQSVLLYDALKKANLPVHFHTIEGAGHGKGFGGADVTEMVDKFFASTLKSDEPVKNEQITSTSKASEPRGAAGSPMGPGRQLSYEQVMARADRNKDGKVTKEEFDGPPRLFPVLDRNNDGEIGQEDFR
ncbi:alpha/beta hydrolase fold domain-containing protein [Blastopirellula sp. JC732]|uniref:Alpha/beta hydrolase fold domain-containing protein n=1 Tax=Blastopirellula sediminis TaxID=2894196 RepID=A0A9X1SEH5_9BACT|nr:alpha/beta hydrolase [Blastopirellula sediminis]MCC9604312.1 alpha/beta hydrolase fold domain-containing protein [Blastopirellula sediminis]MCC9626832.1 alpha/beta hydrolase fold domain-containing protein [Blastopirellula sediminis]